MTEVLIYHNGAWNICYLGVFQDYANGAKGVPLPGWYDVDHRSLVCLCGEEMLARVLDEPADSELNAYARGREQESERLQTSVDEPVAQPDEIAAPAKKALRQPVQPEIAPEYLNTEQAAQYLGLSVQFLEVARHKGGGPLYIKLPQAVRYRRADLDNFMAQRIRRHTSEPE